MAPLLILVHLFLQKTIAEIIASMEISSRFETILEVSISPIFRWDEMNADTAASSFFCQKNGRCCFLNI